MLADASKLYPKLGDHVPVCMVVFFCPIFNYFCFGDIPLAQPALVVLFVYFAAIAFDCVIAAVLANLKVDAVVAPDRYVVPKSLLVKPATLATFACPILIIIFFFT
jgi:hypothetical protein